MCGIVGLLLKKPALHARLGELLTPMLVEMTERGPDSAGVAFYTPPARGQAMKLSLYHPGGAEAVNWPGLAHALAEQLGAAASATVHGNHATLITDAPPVTVRHWLAEHHPQVKVLAEGRLVEVFKDVGTPAEVASRYGFEQFAGSHAVGHTRMATESAVTPERAHPFTAGADFCLVHNGSLSNPCSIRRSIEKAGIHFETDNDTEAACRFIEWRLRQGDDLSTALSHATRGAGWLLHLPDRHGA